MTPEQRLTLFKQWIDRHVTTHGHAFLCAATSLARCNTVGWVDVHVIRNRRRIDPPNVVYHVRIEELVGLAPAHPGVYKSLMYASVIVAVVDALPAVEEMVGDA